MIQGIVRTQPTCPAPRKREALALDPVLPAGGRVWTLRPPGPEPVGGTRRSRGRLGRPERPGGFARCHRVPRSEAGPAVRAPRAPAARDPAGRSRWPGRRRPAEPGAARYLVSLQVLLSPRTLTWLPSSSLLLPLGSAHGDFLQDILARSAVCKTEGVCSTEVGNLPGNVRKNRYKDVLPYDQTNDLSLLQEEGHGDYINGNFIRGTDGSQVYIATQGPLSHSMLDFWRLVWEFGVKVILKACREMENGRKKCEHFWAQEWEPLQIGLFCIILTRETRLNTDIVLRTLQVTFQKNCPSVYQLQYMSWPDRGVPSNPEHVLTMVEEAYRLQGSGPSPLCVHCSVGCGTGVLCTVDYVRQLLLTQMIPPNFSLFNVVLEMRNQRPAAVQTEEQYRFLYHTVAQMFSALQNTNPLYQNFKEHCAPVYEDALSFQTSLALTTTPRPVGEAFHFLPALRARGSISEPGPPGLAMADTYAVVQKRGAPAGPGAGARGAGAGADEAPLYSQVRPRARRPPAHAEDARGLLPGGGESRRTRLAGVGKALAAPRSPGPQRCPAGPRLWGCCRTARRSGPLPRWEVPRPGRESLATPAGPGLARRRHPPRPPPLPPPGPGSAEDGAPSVCQGSVGLSRSVGAGVVVLPTVPADQSPAGPDAYEDVVDGPQTGGLGFNLRIGRPKGPRDPPADWSQV
ncbi:LOW QUALITY PROTEIN: tyrosine-protein phosphatase non-receptor type 18 [Lycaon pictus]